MMLSWFEHDFFLITLGPGFLHIFDIFLFIFMYLPRKLWKSDQINAQMHNATLSFCVKIIAFMPLQEKKNGNEQVCFSS